MMHLVDLSADGGDVESAVAAIEAELGAFDPSLLQRPRMLVGSKLDAAEDGRRAELRRCAERRGLPSLEISAVARRGVDPLLERIAALLDVEDGA